MMRSSRNRLVALVAVSAAGLALTAVPPAGAVQGAVQHKASKKSHGEAAVQDRQAKLAFFDSRQSGSSLKTLRVRANAQSASPAAAVTRTRTSLGVQGVVSIDPLTGTPRQVARLNGFLTRHSSASPARIALRYVRSHRGLFNLDASALSALTLRQDYTDVTGTHHLSFQQLHAGIPVFGNGLKANVSRTGRLISVQGSPLATMSGLSAAPAISATAARAAALRNAEGKVRASAASASRDAQRTTKFSSGDQASLVYFRTVTGTRLAWQTQVAPTSAELYTSVVDAVTGQVLYRRSLVNSDNSTVWENFPGAPRGGQKVKVNFNRRGWLTHSATELSGPNAHVYTDVNDSNADDPGEDVSANHGNAFRYPFTRFPSTATPCIAAFPCSWAPDVPFSWQTNRAQNATQVFFFVNNFHDHLAKAPIGFTPAAGNFQGDDALQAEPLDGANTAAGLPDVNHVDNANMATPADGQSPRMQMYLFHQPNTTYPDQDPFIASNGGDEADVVYHEYTHGLSNRLVTDVNGNSTLGNLQAGSMGEAWSDWYAMDYLVSQGMFRDTPADGDLRVGQYVGAGLDLIRTQPMDCKVGSTSPKCPGTDGAGPGGYTYGDFGKIAGTPEVHADGEIWGETLWDLRDALGQRKTESLVTRAMELSPANPSYLDMRNSIIQADTNTRSGADVNRIWRVFAHRGMGYFAGSVDGDDTAPVEDFSMPPAANTPKANVSGTVTDTDTHAPLAGALVGFGGHTSGFPTDLAATTTAAGRYIIRGVFVGTYPDVFANKLGYDREVLPTLTVPRGGTTADFAIRRDWASGLAGGAVTDFTGPDFTSFGCGPGSAIDQSQGSGWGSTSDDDPGDAVFAVTPKSVTVKLAATVDISQIGINPSNTCGDGGSASTKDYTVETSPDGNVWTVANQGAFDATNRGMLNLLTPTSGATGVAFVRFTMIDPQVPGDFATTCADPTQGPFSGCQFMDMSELEVFGAPSS
jgi:extracellular elastinolytic metalloproteinase